VTGERLESRIDRRLLEQSLRGFLREFEAWKTWRSDPSLYVKIPLFATDLVISSGPPASASVREGLLAVLGQVPRLLQQAALNLRSPREVALRVAQDMVRDAIGFYRRDIRAFLDEKVKHARPLRAANEAALEALGAYGELLRRMEPGDSFAAGEAALQRIVSESFGYPRPVSEILQIAREGVRETEMRLEALARSMDGSGDWMRLVEAQKPRTSTRSGLLGLYVSEMKRLRAFFHGRDILAFPPGEKVKVTETPSYLRSLRATASYKAPPVAGKKGCGIFYITPGEEDLSLIAKHCPYLTAHETYPGHHILDHIRLHHANPIRRQVESPLFYEGWACYAEQLLDETGYVTEPEVRLIQLKRQLWRALRAVLDVELHTGEILPEAAALKVSSLGFSPARARRQVRRFCLTPGYQLCYFVGAHEIRVLRESYGGDMGLKRFHEILLGGGEIPFDLVAERMEAAKEAVGS
jgi:uncharacterized protein (DUF885 family)